MSVLTRVSELELELGLELELKKGTDSSPAHICAS